MYGKNIVQGVKWSRRQLIPGRGKAQEHIAERGWEGG